MRVAQASLPVVDVGPEDVGHAGPNRAPHSELQRQLGRGLWQKYFIIKMLQNIFS